jgi:PilZ domain
LVPFFTEIISDRVALIVDTEFQVRIMKFLNTAFSTPTQEPELPTARQEVRCAVRFPLSLPVVVETAAGGVPALTKNVSSNGVLFELDQNLSVGVDIHFDLRMPRTVLGTPHDVLVHCTGRVVRCSLSQDLHLAAATIDEYQFAEH